MSHQQHAGTAAPITIEPYLRVPLATSPAWLAGNRIAFLENSTGLPQVWTTGLGAGEPVPLTHLPNRIGALLAAPDGTRLVFGMDAGGDERQQLWSLTPDGAAVALTDQPRVIHTFGAFSPDGRQFAYASNARDDVHFDIWTIELDRPTGARLVMATDETLRPIAWSPDGASLLVHRSNTHLDNDLFLVPAGGGEPVLLTPHTGEAAIPFATFAPDGRALYLLTNQDREFIALARLDLATGDREMLADPDWDVEALAVAPAGDRLAYAVNIDGVSTITLLELAEPDERQVSALPDGVVSGLTWSPAGDVLAFALSGPQYPSDIWVTGLDGLARRVTTAELGGLDRNAFVVPETIRFPSFDGREIPAFWYQPGDAGDGPWPVVVDVHGGPEGQRRVEFNPVIQFLLARGFAVLSTNVRGSTGYGKTFCHLDDVERRMDAVADLDAANAWLRSRPEVAADKLVVFGASYGGFMVLSSLTTYPDHWAAGVDVVGIANFITFFENTGPWRRHLRSPEYGDPEHDHDLLVAISPIHQAERITAPLLVLHGRNDPRVPLAEAEQIVARLQALDRDVSLRIYDDEGHGLIKLANRIDGYGAMADFLDRVLST